MSNDSAEKRQAFERWVTSLRPDGSTSPVVLGEESGVTSLDEQKTLVRNLPKDLVRKLREREASRPLGLEQVDPDSTAIFHPPPDLIARARRLVPPPKPERGTSSAPPEPQAEPRPTPVVTAPPADEVATRPEAEPQPVPGPTLLVAAPLSDEVATEPALPVVAGLPQLPEPPEPPLPVLVDAVDSEDPPPAMVSLESSPREPSPEPAAEPARTSALGWTLAALGCAALAAYAWFVLAP